MSMFSSEYLYGGPQPRQPNPAAAAAGIAVSEGTDVHTRTVARGPLSNPTLVLVGLLAIAALLIDFSVRLEVSG
jgi:hypothetical protein